MRRKMVLSAALVGLSLLSFIGSATGGGATSAAVCLPSWLVWLLAAFALMPDGLAVDVIRAKLGVPADN